MSSIPFDQLRPGSVKRAQYSRRWVSRLPRVVVAFRQFVAGHRRSILESRRLFFTGFFTLFFALFFTLFFTLFVASCAFCTDARAQSSTVVHFEAPDRFQLGGTFHAANAAGPGMLLLHQCDREGPLSGYEELAPLLATRGFHVLEFDFRGFGASRNEQYPEFRSRMDEITPLFPGDVDAAYAYLIGRTGVDSAAVGIVGASCGATQAIFLAQKHASVKALVFLSGSLWAGAPEAYDTVASIPVMIATSENDRVTDRLITLFSASQAPRSRIIVYKGDLHGTPLLDLDDRLAGGIVDWLSEVVSKPAGQ